MRLRSPSTCRRFALTVVPLAVCLASLSCSEESASPAAPSDDAAPTAATPAAPAPAPSVAFALDMPIAPGDQGDSAYSIWPFGVHGGGHATDGHPGWDVEFRPGAQVLAAADGTVQNAMPEPGAADVSPYE